jgi:hypothetical protein
MSQSNSPESSRHQQQRRQKMPEPLTPSAPPAADDPDAGHEWTVGDDGVVDEPHDHSRPSFDDELDPTDAP